VLDSHLQRGLYGAQVFVGRSAQVRKARVAGRGEGVFEDQAVIIRRMSSG
jgi:hypothetical protein